MARVTQLDATEGRSQMAQRIEDIFQRSLPASKTRISTLSEKMSTMLVDAHNPLVSADYYDGRNLNPLCEFPGTENDCEYRSCSPEPRFEE